MMPIELPYLRYTLILTLASTYTITPSLSPSLFPSPHPSLQPSNRQSKVGYLKTHPSYLTYLSEQHGGR